MSDNNLESQDNISLVDGVEVVQFSGQELPLTKEAQAKKDRNDNLDWYKEIESSSYTPPVKVYDFSDIVTIDLYKRHHFTKSYFTLQNGKKILVTPHIRYISVHEAYQGYLGLRVVSRACGQHQQKALPDIYKIDFSRVLNPIPIISAAPGNNKCLITQFPHIHNRIQSAENYYGMLNGTLTISHLLGSNLLQATPDELQFILSEASRAPADNPFLTIEQIFQIATCDETRPDMKKKDNIKTTVVDNSAFPYPVLEIPAVVFVVNQLPRSRIPIDKHKGPYFYDKNFGSAKSFIRIDRQLRELVRGQMFHRVLSQSVVSQQAQVHGGQVWISKWLNWTGPKSSKKGAMQELAENEDRLRKWLITCKPLPLSLCVLDLVTEEELEITEEEKQRQLAELQSDTGVVTKRTRTATAQEHLRKFGSTTSNSKDASNDQGSNTGNLASGGGPLTNPTNTGNLSAIDYKMQQQQLMLIQQQQQLEMEMQPDKFSSGIFTSYFNQPLQNFSYANHTSESLNLLGPVNNSITYSSSNPNVLGFHFPNNVVGPNNSSNINNTSSVLVSNSSNSFMNNLSSSLPHPPQTTTSSNSSNNLGTASTNDSATPQPNYLQSSQYSFQSLNNVGPGSNVTTNADDGANNNNNNNNTTNSTNPNSNSLLNTSQLNSSITTGSHYRSTVSSPNSHSIFNISGLNNLQNTNTPILSSALLNSSFLTNANSNSHAPVVVGPGGHFTSVGTPLQYYQLPLSPSISPTHSPYKPFFLNPGLVSNSPLFNTPHLNYQRSGANTYKSTLNTHQTQGNSYLSNLGGNVINNSLPHLSLSRIYSDEFDPNLLNRVSDRNIRTFEKGFDSDDEISKRPYNMLKNNGDILKNTGGVGSVLSSGLNISVTPGTPPSILGLQQPKFALQNSQTNSSVPGSLKHNINPLSLNSSNASIDVNTKALNMKNNFLTSFTHPSSPISRSSSLFGVSTNPNSSSLLQSSLSGAPSNSSNLSDAIGSSSNTSLFKANLTKPNVQVNVNLPSTVGIGSSSPTALSPLGFIASGMPLFSQTNINSNLNDGNSSLLSTSSPSMLSTQQNGNTYNSLLNSGVIGLNAISRDSSGRNSLRRPIDTVSDGVDTHQNIKRFKKQ